MRVTTKKETRTHSEKGEDEQMRGLRTVESVSLQVVVPELILYCAHIDTDPSATAALPFRYEGTWGARTCGDFLP